VLTALVLQGFAVLGDTVVTKRVAVAMVGHIWTRIPAP
jgi:hypothetical protein